MRMTHYWKEGKDVKQCDYASDDMPTRGTDGHFYWRWQKVPGSERFATDLAILANFAEIETLEEARAKSPPRPLWKENEEEME